MSERRRGSLTTRVLVVLALATITPTSVVGYLAIRHARDDLEREVVRGNLALIRALGQSVDVTLQSARRSQDLAAASWADERTSADARADDEAERRRTERLLRRLRREVPLFATLSIVSPEDGGRVLYGDPISAGAGVGSHSFGGYIGDVVYEGERPRVQVVSQARSRTGELVGVFVAQLDLRFISDALSEARLGQGARLLVVDGDGQPVARSDGIPLAGATSLRGENPAVDRALGTATEGSLEAGGVVAVYRNLSSYQTLRGVRWAIILEQPTEDAYALAYKTTRDTIVAGLVVLGAALIVGFLLATRLTRPLHVLAERADAIARAGGVPEDAPPAPLDAMGEIGVLAHRIEEMARRIGEREQLQAAMAHGDRLSTVGTMSASVAHEINNPLTTVLGYANLLLEDKPPEHADRAGLELIADEAARMKTIVGALLDYSRAEPTNRGETADVNRLVTRTAALLEPALRRDRVHLVLELAEHLPRAAADEHSLQQIFVNLAQNAAQASPAGGRITIDTRLADDAMAIEVRLTDEGPGVSPADRERIFDPFFTTKEPGAGTGLGLAVCRHLASKLGARIDVTDGPDGRGARFRVVIPISD
ncbi:MAG TPA: ATP-binding protein [Kofleriaceae bacterium]|nr:ATP-binding protein [Kofleriaceae bacterium]